MAYNETPNQGDAMLTNEQILRMSKAERDAYAHKQIKKIVLTRFIIPIAACVAVHVILDRMDKKTALED